MQATKENFRSILLRELSKYEWAKDEARFTKAMDAVDRTLNGTYSCAIDGASWIMAWRECGFKGKPTYKAIHAMPATAEAA